MGNLHLVTGYAGKSHITSADHGAFHAALFGDGDFVLGGFGNKFEANFSAANMVRIQSGHLLMQGRHAYSDTFTDLMVTSGTAGKRRNDLIVARYSVDTTTGVESCTFAVVTGTASDTPSDPEIGTKNILTDTFAAGDTHDFALYRIEWHGTNAGNLVPLFDVLPTPAYYVDKMQGLLDSINDVSETIPAFQFGTASIRYRNYKESEVEVSFPTPFSKKPLVLTTQVFEDHPIIVKEEDISTTGFTARVGLVEGGAASGEEATYRDFSWVAIQRI